MKIFNEICEDPDFREFVLMRLKSAINYNGYSFPSTLPKLYRYRSLSDFAVKDIKCEELTITLAEQFNDLYDSSMAYYDVDTEISDILALYSAINIKLSADFFKNYKKVMDNKSIMTFPFLRNKTYVGCFSETPSSNLMWSHYADSNKGICIEYDFNKIKNTSKLNFKKYFFPVSYSNTPVNISDFLKENNKKHKYSFEAAALCAILNKSSDWQYEKEWRFLLQLNNLTNERISINSGIKPDAVYLGYHFLKNFLQNAESSDDKNEKEPIVILIDLLDYLLEHELPVFFMSPKIGLFEIQAHKIDIHEIKRFLQNKFYELGKLISPMSMEYYNAIHSEFCNIVLKH